MPHLNIEMKAKCNDLTRIRNLLNGHEARFVGTDHQIDTYFHVSNGRLKLREWNIENFLIHYERTNQPWAKSSIVTLFSTTNGNGLKDILIKSLWILCTVDKKREIYFIGNVKFHLDRVENLGTFVEIEAIDSDGTISRDMLSTQCANYMKLFGIDSKDTCAGSYSDMLLEAQK